MEQKDVALVVREYTAALRDASPEIPDEKFARIASSTADLVEAVATAGTELAIHSPASHLVREEIAALVVMVKTEIENVGAEARRRSEGDSDLQHQINQHGDRLELLEERSLDAREADGE